MNAHQIAGRLMMVRIPGTELDDATASFLRDNHIRAVCLFRSNMVDAEQLSRLTAALRQVMGPQALIAIDQEGGAVVRTTWLPVAPAAMALGAADDEGQCHAIGAAVARGIKALGFNWNFAPVLDLNNNPDNPVIAERAFGADPKRVTALATAWMEGSLSEGVACCIKHFPGHGDTHVDSHRDLPVVDKPLAQLQDLELAPFRATLQAPALMTAHITYPALDADAPATLSHRILSGLLRDEWDYQGVVITDGMDMRAIADRYGIGKAAVGALAAGADMIMELGARPTQQEAVDALTDAIAAGQFADDDLAKRLARLDGLAASYPAAGGVYATENEDRASMLAAWQRGLSMFRQPQAPARGAKVRLVMRADTVSDGVAEAGASAAQVGAMLARLYDVETVTYGDAETFDWSTLPDDGRLVILASCARIRYGRHARATWQPDLHLALWNPFHALDIAAPALIAYGFADLALDAVAGWLAGELEAKGQVPVPGFA